MFRTIAALLLTSVVSPAFAGPRATIDPNAALAQSQATGRPVLAIAGSTGCVYCKKMAAELAADPTVQEAANNFIVLLLDTDDPVRWPRWSTRYKVEGGGIPKVFVVRADGQQIYSDTGAPSDLNAFLERQLEDAGTILDVAALSELTIAARDLNRGWRRRVPHEVVEELTMRLDPKNYSAPARQIAQIIEQMRGLASDRLAAAERDLEQADRQPEKAFEAAVAVLTLQNDYGGLPQFGEELAGRIAAFEEDRITAPLFERAAALLKAESLYEAGKRDDAVQALESLVSEHSGTPVATYAERTLARWEKQQGSPDTVAKTGAAATAEPPANADTERAAVQLRLGKLMLERDADKARKYFERAIEFAPKSPIAAEAKKLLAQ